MSFHRPFLAFAIIALSVVPDVATAITYSGNPSLQFHVERPAGDLISGNVKLNKVRVYRCNNAGWTDYSVNGWIDPVAGYSVTVDGGDLCGAQWYWGSSMTLTGVGFTATMDDPNTAVQFGNPTAPTSLAPVTVTSGTMTGAAPALYADVY